jgi:hypothetical protein
MNDKATNLTQVNPASACNDLLSFSPEMLVSAIAHRVCCGTEHDPLRGKIHGYCVVCGVPWPCDTAKKYL